MMNSDSIPERRLGAVQGFGNKPSSAKQGFVVGLDQKSVFFHARNIAADSYKPLDGDYVLFDAVPSQHKPGQLEDDPLRTTDVAELVPPMVLYIAEDFRPSLFQARNDSLDISTANAMCRMPRVFAGSC